MLSCDAEQVAAAQERAAEEAAGKVLPMLLTEKQLPSFSDLTAAAMTGPKAPAWKPPTDDPEGPPPIWLFDDCGDTIYGPTYHLRAIMYPERNSELTEIYIRL
eukprot:COSAG01_NODE_6308_length_3737_cov_2.062534_3_plen_103_part_00